MSLYRLVIPLGDLTLILFLACFLSGYGRGRIRRDVHIWLAWATLAVAAVHAAIVIYLRGPFG